MTMYQPPAQAYQPSPGYGTPPPAGVPGQPVPGQQVMPPAEIKWSGLATGGGKVPVVCFIGRLIDIVEDPRQYGLYLMEKYDQVQILESPAPWPWATIDIPIKYSDKENSGWGHHVTSAKALGLATAATNLAMAKAELVGKIYEMRQSAQSYGENQAGQAMTGDVWRFVRIVQPGAPMVTPQPQYAVPPAVAPAPVNPAALAPAAPATPAIPPAVDPAIAAALVAAAVPLTPAVAPVINVAPDPSDTPAIRAKKLLHGRALNEFLAVALPDELLKSDPALVNSIFDGSLVLGLKSSGQVVMGPDLKFTVVG